MRVAIVSIINELYIKYFKVMLTSLVVNNTDLNVDYVVLYDGTISDEEKNNIKKIYNNIKFIKLKNEFQRYDQFLTKRREEWIGKNYSVFSRFEIFELEEYDKLIYLDIDIIIDKKIDYLINECNESECYAVKQGTKHHFNAGIMVINKKTNFLEYKNRCIKIIKLHTSFSGNQFVFNECFKNTTVLISNIYNLDTLHNECEKILKNNEQVILHYPGEGKPWNKNKPFSEYYSSARQFNKNVFLDTWDKYYKIYKDKYETN